MPRVALSFRFRAKAAPYLKALEQAGIEPVEITPEQQAASLEGVDGLVLTGGSDIDPSFYGQELDPRTTGVDPERDALELKLLQQALAADLPVLAICRGMQIFNIAHRGGTLHQHIEHHAVRGGDPSEPVHEAVVEPGTKLATILGPGAHPVNSRHHQAADQIGDGLVVSARAGDGVVEALERPDRRFAIAVQWHPEDQIRRDPEQLRLFEAFAEACRTEG